jgi:hypothetical protein
MPTRNLPRFSYQLTTFLASRSVDVVDVADSTLRQSDQDVVKAPTSTNAALACDNFRILRSPAMKSLAASASTRNSSAGRLLGMGFPSVVMGIVLSEDEREPSHESVTDEPVADADSRFTRVQSGPSGLPDQNE